MGRLPRDHTQLAVVEDGPVWPNELAAAVLYFRSI